MKSRITYLILFTLISFSLVAQEKPFEAYVQFNTDSHSLSDEAKNKLDKVARYIAQKTVGMELSVTGFTDDRGSIEYNEALSKKRAETVKAYLQAKGIEVHIIAYEGETKPIAANTTDAGRQQNRSVQITQYLPEREEERDENLAAELEHPTENVTKEATPATIKKGDGCIVIVNQQDTVYLPTKRGTVLCIPPGIFRYRNGQEPGPNDSITVTMKDYYQKSEFILAALSTQAHGNMLESGGMVNIDVQGQKGALKLKRGEKLQVMFPFEGERKEDMNLFYGRPNSSDIVIWTATSGTRSTTTYEQRNNVRHKAKYKKKRRFKRGRKRKLKSGRRNQGAGRLSNDLTLWMKFANAFKTKKRRWTISGAFTSGGTNTFMSRKATEKYLEEFEDQYNKNFDVSPEDLQHYMLASARLGWINCDRFYNVPATKKTNMVADTDDEYGKQVFVVFNNINSIMPAVRLQKIGYRVNAIPKKESITIVGIKKEDGKTMMAMYPTTVSRGIDQSLEYKEYTLEELKDALKILDSPVPSIAQQ